MLNDFIGKNRDALEKFSAMSREAGARADWVQGGGGNTSVKLPGGLMESTAHSIIDSLEVGDIVHITDAEIADLKKAFNLKG